MNLQQKALEMLKGFRPHQDENRRTVVTTADEAGARASELAHFVHDQLGMSLPDDWTYREIYDALHLLADGTHPEEYEPEPDAYTADLLRWLQECPAALNLVDEAREEFGTGQYLTEDISNGQYLARLRIMEAVAEWLAKEMGADEDEADA